MIYLLYGTDIVKSGEKLQILISTLQNKKPDTAIVRVDAENFKSDNILEFIGGQGLFENKLIVVFDHVTDHTEGAETLKKYAKEIAESDNIFLLRETKLAAPIKNQLEKYAEKTEIHDGKDEVKKKDNSLFTVADALGSRDVKNLWVAYQRAKLKQFSDEEIHGIMLWGIRCMLLSKSAASAKESGLNPFVFQKNKKFARNYRGEELIKLSQSMVSLYHESRRGRHELGNALEKFTLTLRY
jgi:hypothetical protein